MNTAATVNESKKPSLFNEPRNTWLGEENGQEFLWITCNECGRHHARWRVVRISHADFDTYNTAVEIYEHRLFRFAKWTFTTPVIVMLGGAVLAANSMKWFPEVMDVNSLLWGIAISGALAFVSAGILLYLWSKDDRQTINQFFQVRDEIFNRYGLKAGKSYLMRNLHPGNRGVVILPQVS